MKIGVYTSLAHGRGSWPNGAFGNDVIEFEGMPRTS